MSTTAPPSAAPAKDIFSYLNDKDFHGMPVSARIKFLSQEDSDFAALPLSAQTKLIDLSAAKVLAPPPLKRGLASGATSISAPSVYEGSLGDFTPALPGGLRGDTYSLPSPRDIVSQAPSVGAAALTTAFPEVSIPLRLGAAFAGGAFGSGVEQVGEKLNAAAPPSAPIFGNNPGVRAAVSGAEQMLYELPAGLATLLGKKAASTLPKKADEKLAETVSESLGMNLKPGEVAPKLSRKEEKLATLSEAAQKNIADTFGVKDTPHEAGVAIHNATQRASKIAHDLSSENYKKLQGLVVDLGPHSETILSIPPSLLPPELAAAAKGIVELRANNFPEAMVKKAEKAAFGKVPFNVVQDLRTAVREASDLPPGQALMANANIGNLKNIKGKLSGILDQAAKSQGKEAEWRTANDFHKGIGDLFERGLGSEINRTGISDPQRIVSLIKPHDIKAVRDMKAIFSYAEKSGSPVEVAQAKAAQRKFQRGFLDQKILDAPVENWRGIIDKNVGRDVLAEVLGNTEAEKNLYAIATTAGQIAPDSKLVADALAIAIAKTGLPHAGYGSVRTILKEVAQAVTPSVSNTRKLVGYMQTLAKPQTGNAARAAEGLVELWMKTKEKQPPESLALPPSSPPMPMFPNPYPGPIRP